MLREARRYEESYQVLAAALERTPTDTALLYDTAMAAERIDRIDEMERLLRRLMQLKPDDPHAYNALGYTFADRNLRLPEAYELIAKAMTLAPEDAHIIDSMGWVYFRMGNLSKAREVLERVYALRPEASMGIKAIELRGGGEPTINPHFFELCEYILDAGINLGLATNGAAWKDVYTLR